MSDAVAIKSAANGWSALLEETRLALSTLCTEDLEELAARADCMLSATLGDDPVRQRIPRPHGRELLELTKEYGLLSDLLVATDVNLKVLRRMRGHKSGHARVGEATSRWVR
jgi:hypothetical protein